MSNEFIDELSNFDDIDNNTDEGNKHSIADTIVTNDHIDNYNAFKFQQEVFGVNVEELVELLEFKKNIILQGAPGVGKTHTSKRLAYTMMGCKDDSRILQVQFHQSYSYEDFIMGLTPTKSGGFEFKYGPFYNICTTADKDRDRDYFIIIDEINRGNISRILGEAFSLLENGHRDEKITLKYNSTEFFVPPNVYVIGTMNTADRGLVMLDYALRRRFGFYPLEPGFKSDGFRGRVARIGSTRLNRIIRKLIELNKEISADPLLGEGFQIGHSYFCSLTKDNTNDEVLKKIVKYEIMPLLREYWYDDTTDKVGRWEDAFNMIFIDNK